LIATKLTTPLNRSYSESTTRPRKWLLEEPVGGGIRSTTAERTVPTPKPDLAEMERVCEGGREKRALI
jgi:hypothetical protein